MKRKFALGRQLMKQVSLAFVFIFLMSAGSFAAVIYVDVEAGGQQTGKTWADAYVHLADALDGAKAKDEIWVAKGTYYPDRSKAHPKGTGDRNKSFFLITGVSLYGGFDPDQGVAQFGQRSWKKYPAILSGNIGDAKLESDNTYHVVENTAGQNETALMDGFHIRYGTASGPQFPDNCGAGMYNGKTSPTIRNCRFFNNRAGSRGGAVFNSQGSPVILGCEFEANEANTGGAVSNEAASPEITDCRFAGNRALTGSGGAVYNDDSDPVLTAVSFFGNTASYGGGAIYNYDTSSPCLYNAVFSGNTAGYGGAVHNSLNADLTAVNCTFVRNTADTSGGGIYSRNSSRAFIYNTILWEDAPDEIDQDSSSSSEVGHCDVMAVSGTTYPGTGNINADPELTFTFHLMQASPCIDQGDTGKLPPWLTRDVDGNDRILNQVVDMGADEFDPEAVVGVENLLDQSQMESFASLRQEVGEDNFTASIFRGAIQRLDLNLERQKSFPTESADDFALSFLGQYPDLFGLGDPSIEFRIRKRVGDDRKVLLFDQYYRDIPVYGAWIKLNVADLGSSFMLRSLTGNFSPDLAVEDILPRLSFMDALNSLTRYLGIKDIQFIQLAVPSKLWLFDPGLRTDDPVCEPNHCPDRSHKATLVWRIIYYACGNNGGLGDAFIDAGTGEVLLNRSRVYVEDPKIRISTAMGNTSKTCFGGQRTTINAWFDQDGECATRYDCSHPTNYCHWDALHCAHPDAEGYNAFDHTWDTYHFYYDLFGRRSYDGGSSGKKMWMFLDVGFNTPNASSVDCGAYRVHYFDSGMATLDIIGHEFAHSVHDEEANFVYEGQSGAVAEHVADMFGHFLGFWTGLDPDWMHGEDGSGADSSGCGRNMADPAFCGQPDTWADRDFPSPTENNDHGRVHKNCGILNRAGYLMVEGGVVGNVTVAGMGEEKIRRIYYETIQRLGKNPSFRNFADDVVDTCEDLTGRYGITATDCCQISNAFAAVDIPTYFPDTDCDGETDDGDLDNDNDGVADPLDNCRNVANPRQADVDGDGLGDACDDDADGDGVLNTEDDCPLTPGEGDVCLDDDGDGAMNAVDNCPGTYNRDQADLDGDGTGDACDGDTDGDAYADTLDNCPYVFNPDQTNSDTDDLGDDCDNCPNYGASDDQSDFDGDGMGDVCDDDIDNDGWDNETDQCDDEAVPSSSGLVICPYNHTCRVGCYPDRIIRDSRFYLSVIMDALQPEPGDRPTLTIPLDIDALVPLQTELFENEDVIHLAAGVSLDRSAMPETIRDNPMTLTFSILNEAGVSVAAGDMNLTQAESQNLILGFSMAPSFALREPAVVVNGLAAKGEADESDKALPAYYLSVSLQYEYEDCADVCAPCYLCRQGCDNCSCGTCDECSQCDAPCGPCQACEAQVRSEYVEFFGANAFQVTAHMNYEQACGDFNGDGDVDGADLAEMIFSGRDCMISFSQAFGQ